MSAHNSITHFSFRQQLLYFNQKCYIVLLVTLSIIQTYTQGLKFNEIIFTAFAFSQKTNILNKFRCVVAEQSMTATTDLVPPLNCVLRCQQFCPPLLLHHQGKYQYIKKGKYVCILVLLFKQFRPCEFPESVSENTLCLQTHFEKFCTNSKPIFELQTHVFSGLLGILQAL